MSKTTTLHVHHAFLYISLPSLPAQLRRENQILYLLGNGNGKAINSTISVWTRTGAFSLQLQPKSPSFK